jgi:hypothetical protein
VAGFQNIDERLHPAATPAKDAPCPQALCSRMAKPPACAAEAVASTAAADPSQRAERPTLRIGPTSYSNPPDFGALRQ